MLASENTVPCVVFAFNRPGKLEQVLATLKTQEIDRLIVFVDGPRDDPDVKLVEQCRGIASHVDWVDKELHFGKQNSGLPGLSANIGVIFDTYRWAVFVEDDCLPMPGFYSFMRRALFHYHSEKKVFSVSGYQPLRRKYFKNYPYSLISVWRFSCWGWATWRDRWKLVSPYLLKYSELFDGLKNVPDITGDDLAAMAKGCSEGRIRTWDVQVATSTLWLKMVHLLPAKGLIRNIGHDATGVHQGKDPFRVHNINVSTGGLPERIVWLEEVEPSSYYTKELKRFVNHAIQPLAYRRFFRNVLKLCRLT